MKGFKTTDDLQGSIIIANNQPSVSINMAAGTNNTSHFTYEENSKIVGNLSKHKN